MKKTGNFFNWDNLGAALITGASAGIGTEFARQLAALGFNLVLVARRKNRLEELATELQQKESIKVRVLTADLSIIEDIERVATEIKKMDNLDVLINNAGFGTRGFFHEVDFKSQLDMMTVHNTTPVYLCRAAIPNMIKRGRGVIINLSSLATFMSFPQSVMYNATKSFLNGFSECLALDLDEMGIRVQALCPGMTHTEFHSVGQYEGYDKSEIPNFLWMTAEETVKQSLKALKKNKVIFIPGRKNRMFKSLWHSPLIGRIIRKQSHKKRQ
ncbi:MAG: SDR family NAD(P)-dependent oxidoreductase [Candidatus Helarchaeota archaeon]